MTGLHVLPVPGIPEIGPGDDLCGAILDAAAAAGQQVRDGDVLAVSSKVVSKADGRYAPAGDRQAAIAGQTVRVVAERATASGVTRIVRSRSGPVLAAAGVDASNVPGEAVLLLPADPDRSAAELRAAVLARCGARVGVIVTDTLGRPWRDGQVDAAIGSAGVCVLVDLAGTPDTAGRPLEVTRRALADEIAAAADLVKGKVEQVPVAIVRGLAPVVTAADPTEQDAGPAGRPAPTPQPAQADPGDVPCAHLDGAARLLRGPEQDWFRYGHVEAARAAIGVPPGTPAVPARPVVPGTVRDRLDRALAVVAAAPHWPGLPLGAGEPVVTAPDADRCLVLYPPTPAAEPAAPVSTGHIALGVLAQRLVVAGWAEDLAITPQLRDDGVLALEVTASDPARFG